MYSYLRYIIIILCSLSFAGLEITGVPSHIKKNIEQRINYKIRPKYLTYNEQLLDQLTRETIEAIKPYGYFNPSVSISSDIESPSNIIINISLNQLTHLKHIHLEYTTPPTSDLNDSLQQVVSSYDFSAFSTENINDIIDAVKFSAYQAGYYDILISRGSTVVNKATNSASLTIMVTPNDMNRFGEIILPKGASPKCFKRYHNIASGDKYNSSQIQIFQRNMMQSGLFSRTSITPIPREVSPSIQDILVDFDRSAPIRYFFGLGMRSNLTEKELIPQAQANATFHIGNCGIELANSLKFSTDGLMVDSRLLFPSETGMLNYGLLSMRFNNNNIRQGDSSKYFQISALVQRVYSAWTHQLSVTLLKEESTLNDENPYLSTLLYPQYKLYSHFFNTPGHLRIKLKAKGGLESLGSDINFYQMTVSSNLFARLKYLYVQNHIVLGRIWTDDFDKFPLSMQYYLGGANSHRGYDSHEINEGSKLFLNRNSAQFPLGNNILVGAFYDTGYCTNTDDQTLNSALGPLISWDPPFAKFDLSIGRLTDSSTWRVHLSIEPKESSE